MLAKTALMSLTQNGTRPQRITWRLRRWSFTSSRTIGSGSVGATVQLAAKCGVGRSGGMPNAILISLTSEDRRARPPIRSWSRGHPPYGLIECAAARIGTWAFKKRRTRSIVRCFSSAGSFYGYTVISACGASEATSIEVCSGCPGTSSGSTSTGVRQFRMTSRDTLYRKSGCTA